MGRGGKGKGTKYVSETDVNDVQYQWIVEGKRNTLPTEEEFTAAFMSLDITRGWKPITRVGFNAMPSWKQKQLVDALQTPPPYAYKFPHKDVEPLEDINYVNWATCVGVERSDAGSEGILFVELDGKKAVCVKSPVKAAAEMYGTMLCQRLSLRCPQMRLVGPRSEEHSLIVNSLKALDAKRPEVERKVHAMLESSHLLLVVEYIQGVELADQFPPQSEKWTRGALGLPSDKTNGQLNSEGKGVLRFLGAVAAFDMIINNFDRLPCIWNNSGNPGNIMFTGNGHPNSIDNMVCCIPLSNEELLSPYLCLIEQVVYAVAAAPDKEHPQFMRIRKFLRDGCVEGHGWPGLGAEVGEEGTLEIQRGFIDCVRSVVYGNGHNEALTIQELEDFVQYLLEYLPDNVSESEAKEEHLLGFEAIEPKFFDRVLHAFKQALDKAEKEPGASSAPGQTLQVVVPDGSQRGRARRHLASVVCGVKLMKWWHPTHAAETHQRLQQRKLNVLRGVVRMSTLAHRAKHVVSERNDAKAEKRHDATGSGHKDFLPLSQLACPAPWPEGVEAARREEWLSPEDFLRAFGMTKEQFSVLPDWKKVMIKKGAKLW